MPRSSVAIIRMPRRRTTVAAATAIANALR
jgi:hypothetical protein